MSLDFFGSFLSAFIPLFVAIDPIGIVPLFMGITQDWSGVGKKKLVTKATLTALIISIIFLVAGQLLFRFLGITEHDFRIGGGIVLLVLAVTDLVFAHPEKTRAPSEDESIGVVPIGIPLIMGPAALTTILIVVESHGTIITLAALITNLIIVWLVFRNSHLISKALGKSGSIAVAKVTSLFMVAIAVMMIRVGLSAVLH
jgi:multiple antibiotic resistance protein